MDKKALIKEVKKAIANALKGSLLEFADQTGKNWARETIHRCFDAIPIFAAREATSSLMDAGLGGSIAVITIDWGDGTTEQVARRIKPGLEEFFVGAMENASGPLEAAFLVKAVTMPNEERPI